MERGITSRSSGLIKDLSGIARKIAHPCCVCPMLNRQSVVPRLADAAVASGQSSLLQVQVVCKYHHDHVITRVFGLTKFGGFFFQDTLLTCHVHPLSDGSILLLDSHTSSEQSRIFASSDFPSGPVYISSRIFSLARPPILPVRLLLLHLQKDLKHTEIRP